MKFATAIHWNVNQKEVKFYLHAANWLNLENNFKGKYPVMGYTIPFV